MAENYVSTNMETGVQVREALTKIESYQPDLFAWTEIGDSVTVNLKSPTTYSGITDPGDYVIYKFSNGPSRIPSTLSPILLSLRDGKKYVSANGAIYTLNSAGDSWISIDEAVDDDTILYVKSDTAPTRTNNTFWFDTSHYDGTSDGYIDLKYYDTNSSSWTSVFNGDNYLKKSVLDPNGKNTDIYTYITEKVAAVVGDYGEFIKHKANQLTLIHITANERTQYAKIINESELRALINDTYKPAIKQTVDDSVSTELDTTQISADSTTLDNSYKSHLANHITADNIASWKNKADADHIHDYTTGNTKLQASQIVSGTFGADQLPDEIKERYYQITTSPAVEFGNTSITDADRKTKYHNGNAFYYETTDETTGENIRKWYRIIDSTKIGTSSWADGIIDFTGKEAKMDWGNITGRPTTLEEFGITSGLYTKTQVDEKFNSIITQVESMNTALADCEGDTGYEYGSKPIWKEVMISNTERDWNSVCYGNDKYVAVGYNEDSDWNLISGNDIAYSTDGINWTESTISSTSRRWVSVCYGNDKYVAVAFNDNHFAYSTDGINWTECIISSTSRRWVSVCYGNDKFVAVARNSNYSAYSTDGINWTESTISNASRRWSSVCYGNGKFVAVAWSTNTFAYSTDGINWTEGMISNTSRSWYSICYGNGKFVAVANGYNYFAYSTDGITWIESTISSTERAWNSVCYGNGKYVAVVLNSNYFAYSTDGINWTEDTISNTSRYWQSVCYGNGKYVAVVLNSNYFAYAPDSLMNFSIDRIGIQYKTQKLSEFDDTMTGTIPQLDCIIKTTDNKIYKTTYNLNSTYTKPDGTLYTTTNSKEPLGATMMEKIVPQTVKNIEGNLSEREWSSVCYGNGKFVAVAYNSKYSAYSTDGINWTESTISNTSRYWQSVCYGNGKYVAVDNSNYFAYSTDGITWTEGMISDSIRSWNSVCYGNGKYIAITWNSNYFAYSTDGINWTESTISDTSRAWNSVCYGNDKFVAVGWNVDSNYNLISGNDVAYSTDGITWTESTISNTSRYWQSVCYGNGKYVAVANNSNYFAYSSDGITWIEGTISSTSRYWFSVCYGNGKFVAVDSGFDNIFAYSSDGITWTEGMISSTNRGWTSVCYGNDKFVIVGY